VGQAFGKMAVACHSSDRPRPPGCSRADLRETARRGSRCNRRDRGAIRADSLQASVCERWRTLPTPATIFRRRESAIPRPRHVDAGASRTSVDRARTATEFGSLARKVNARSAWDSHERRRNSRFGARACQGQVLPEAVPIREPMPGAEARRRAKRHLRRIGPGYFAKCASTAARSDGGSVLTRIREGDVVVHESLLARARPPGRGACRGVPIFGQLGHPRRAKPRFSFTVPRGISRCPPLLDTASP